MECAFAGCKGETVKAVRVLDLETRESEVLGLCRRHSARRLRVAGCRVTCIDPRLSKMAVGK